MAISGALLPGAEPPDRPSAPTPTEETQAPAIPPIVNPEDVESEEEEVQSLTQRLRCLFTVLTVSAPFGFGLGISLAWHACLSKGVFICYTHSSISTSQYLVLYLLCFHLMFPYSVTNYSHRNGSIVSSTVRLVCCICDRPTSTVYAIISLVLFIYAPNHRAIKFHLFHYSRERMVPTDHAVFGSMIRPFKQYAYCMFTLE